MPRSLGSALSGLSLVALIIAAVVLSSLAPTLADAQGGIELLGNPSNVSGFEIAYNTGWVSDWGLLWWKGIDVYVNMPGPMLGGYDTYFSKVLYGPLVREYPVNNGTWLLSYVALPYSPPGSLYPLPTSETYDYKLGEAFLVSLEGDVAIVMISYKDVGNTSIPLNQFWTHIHQGLDGLRIDVLPSASLSPTEMLGLLSGNSSLTDLQYYANQIGSFQSNVYFYINGSDVGTLTSWWLWEVLYYNSWGAPLALTYSGYYQSKPFNINVYVLSNAIQIVTNALYLNNAYGSNVYVDNSLLSIQHPAVVLGPGEQITLYYVIAFNKTLTPGELQDIYSEAQARLLPLIQYPNVSSFSSSPGNVDYTLVLYSNKLLLGNVLTSGNGCGPDSIAYDPSNGYMYVANGNLGVIYVVNPNNQVVTSIRLGQLITAIAYDPSNGYIYVADGSTNSILVINPANDAIVTRISLVYSTPVAFAYDSSNGNLYVATRTGTIYAINPHNQVSAIIHGTFWTTSIAYDPSNGYLYAAGNAVYVIDPLNNSVIKVIVNPAWIDIGAIAYDPVSGYIYVADYLGLFNSLQILDPQNNSVIGSVSGVMGGGLTAIAYDPSNGYLYAADAWSGTVYVIDPLNNSVIANIRVGYCPNAVGYDPFDNEVYVMNGGSDTLSIIVTPTGYGLVQTLTALRYLVGKSYKTSLITGSHFSGVLLVGNLPNNTFYVAENLLYYIEQGNFVIAYQPGSTQYWGYLPYSWGVLQLIPSAFGIAGAVLANTTTLQYTGGNLTVALVGSFTQYGYVPADGFTVAMFVSPPSTPINMTANYALKAWNVGEYGWYQWSGGIYYPYSKTPYIVVQWEPMWYYGRNPWTTGEFNVWVVNPMPDGTVTISNINLVVEGGGNGFIWVSPGDLIFMEVTYDSQDNTIYTTVINLNTSSETTLRLPLYHNFTAPANGYYWVEVNAGSGGDTANWGVLYLTVLNNAYMRVIGS